MGLFLHDELRGGYAERMSNQDFKDSGFLSWVMVGVGI
jgi:hypothetical protein